MLVEIYHCNDNGYEDIHTSITEKNNKIVEQLSISKDFILKAFSSIIEEKKHYAITIKYCDPDKYFSIDEYAFTIDIYNKDSQITFSGNIKLKYGNVIYGYTSDIDKNYENPANNIEEETNPIDLSPDSFFVNENEGSIEVTCPEMCIGTVEESTFKIDETRQAAQDAFMKVMNRKMSNAHKKHEN